MAASRTCCRTSRASTPPPSLHPSPTFAIKASKSIYYIQRHSSGGGGGGGAEGGGGGGAEVGGGEGGGGVVKSQFVYTRT